MDTNKEKIIKKTVYIIPVLLFVLLSACTGNSNIVIGGADGPTQITISENGKKFKYEQISAVEAKRIIDSDEEYILLDTREQDEFDEGHIPGAILIPHAEIDAKAEEILPDKDAQILVYCRSGRRSKIAAESLARIGYTDVKEFGGIIDWPYEVE